MRKELLAQTTNDADAELRAVQASNAELEARLQAHAHTSREQQDRVAQLRDQLQSLAAEMSGDRRGRGALGCCSGLAAGSVAHVASTFEGV